MPPFTLRISSRCRCCVSPPHRPPANTPTTKYYVFLRPERLRRGWSRDRILKTLTDEGIPCYSGSCSEIYLEKAFARLSLQPPERLPIARQLGETSLMFLVHPTLNAITIEKICHCVRRVLNRASA